MITKEDYDKMMAYLNRVTPEELDEVWASIRDIDDGPEIIIDCPEIDSSDFMFESDVFQDYQEGIKSIINSYSDFTAFTEVWQTNSFESKVDIQSTMKEDYSLDNPYNEAA